MPRQHGGDFDPLNLPARKAAVHLPVNVIPCAQADLAQQVAQAPLAQAVPGRQFNQVADRQPLEPYRLLESVADSAAGALGHIQAGDILPVQKDRPGVRLLQPGD